MAKPRRTKPRLNGAMPELASIGRAFAERRLALRLTQQQLADLAGVSRSGIQSLERGSGSIKLASVVEIANTMGLSLELGTNPE